ncbi:hypothetical protein ATO13_22431 [Stappia sp. 22II-S9-Z10]|nr:hypothetical protein ATO13_22431 [Stappia sp. 22II-S9-Z10]
MTKAHRKRIPDGARLQAVLLMLGVPEDLVLGSVEARLSAGLHRLGFEPGARIEWDHHPALWLRDVVDGVMVPHPNDPRFITPLGYEAHKRKTNGSGGTTAGSDKANLAKVARAEARRVHELLAPPSKPKKSKCKARPMPGSRASGVRRKMNGRAEKR